MSGWRIHTILVIIAPHMEIERTGGIKDLLIYGNILARRRIP